MNHESMIVAMWRQGCARDCRTGQQEQLYHPPVQVGCDEVSTWSLHDSAVQSCVCPFSRLVVGSGQSRSPKCSVQPVNQLSSRRSHHMVFSERHG